MYICVCMEPGYSQSVTYEESFKLMCSPIRLKSCHSSNEVYSVSSVLGMLHYYIDQQPAVQQLIICKSFYK